MVVMQEHLCDLIPRSEIINVMAEAEKCPQI